MRNVTSSANIRIPIFRLPRYRVDLVISRENRGNEDRHQSRPVVPVITIFIKVSFSGSSSPKGIKCQEPVVHDELGVVECQRIFLYDSGDDDPRPGHDLDIAQDIERILRSFVRPWPVFFDES